MSASDWDSALSFANGDRTKAARFLAENGVEITAEAKRRPTLSELSSKTIFDQFRREGVLPPLVVPRTDRAHLAILGVFANNLSKDEFEEILTKENLSTREKNAMRVTYYKKNIESIDILAAHKNDPDFEDYIDSDEKPVELALYHDFDVSERVHLLPVGAPGAVVFDIFIDKISMDTPAPLDKTLREIIRSEFNAEDTQVFVSLSTNYIDEVTPFGEIRIPIVFDLDTTLRDAMRIMVSMAKNSDFGIPENVGINIDVLAPHLAIYNNGKRLEELIDPDEVFEDLQVDPDNVIALLNGMKTRSLITSDALNWILYGIDGMVVNPRMGTDLARSIEESGMTQKDYIESRMKLTDSDYAKSIRRLYSGEFAKAAIVDDADNLLAKLDADPDFVIDVRGSTREATSVSDITQRL